MKSDCPYRGIESSDHGASDFPILARARRWCVRLFVRAFANGGFPVVKLLRGARAASLAPLAPPSGSLCCNGGGAACHRG